MNGVQLGVVKNEASLRHEFEDAQPFRHVVIEEFLDESFLRALKEEFPGFDAGLSTNELGERGGKAVRPDLASLGPAYAQLDQLFKSAEFLAFLSAITGIPKLLYDPEYVGGGTHENRHGQDLDTHVDFNYHPGTRHHRRLNLILFLNPEWDAAWGGVLELQKDPALAPAHNVRRAVVPIQNRCVIFETTESSWHGFETIQLPPVKQHLSRRSIAVYYYTRERPREETAPSHGTVYLPDPMPDYVEPGHTLTAAEAHHLAVQFARRDTQIRYLYERELEFSRIAQSPAYRLARALTWPLRQLRDWFGG